jgi:biotin carboxylase
MEISHHTPIGVLYEHPEWFKPLFAELDRRGVQYEEIHAARHSFDPSQRDVPYSLVVNRMSPSAWLRGHGHAVFHVANYLGYLDDIGVNVINGYEAYRHEISKTAQLALMSKLGVRHPAATLINHPALAPQAAAGLTFPVLLKPNVGGSGAGIVSFPDEDELAQAAADGRLDLGPDGTALIQEHLPAQDDRVYRIEILDDRYLYCIALDLEPGTFNLCPADYCQVPGITDGVSGRRLPVTAFDPPTEVVETAQRLLRDGGMELGGVEYLINDRDGLPYFYDINALSNFVADARRVVGFDPFVDLVDFIIKRAGVRENNLTA